MTRLSEQLPRLYGRKQDRPLKPRQARLVAELLPKVCVTLPEAGTLDFAELFGGNGKVRLEIGFGGAEHLAAQAEAHPEIGFIGAEPFVNGVAKALSEIEERSLKNIRIHPDDVRPLLECLPDGGLERIVILFPDPWPKKRHHKRRLVNAAFAERAARLLRPGGEVRFASDIADYARQALFHLSAQPEFEWMADGPEDWRRRPEDQPPTRYESKGVAAGRRCAYLRFLRR